MTTVSGRPLGLHPTALALALKHRMNVFPNTGGSEFRWEAWAYQKHCAFSLDSPNLAILDCATAIRKGIEYPNRGDNIQ